MLDAPQHDWTFYDAKTRDCDAAWNRGLSTSERFDLYASLFNTIWNAQQDLPRDSERLDSHRWQEKLAMRRRMVDAFHKLDEIRRERSASNDPS
jgi:hypothetical protein